MTNTRLFANIIGGALIGGFLGALFALFLIPIPEANKEIVIYMIGQLSGFAGGIIAYHYASKSGDTKALETDAKRAETLGKMADLATGALAASPPAAGPTGNPGDPVHTVEEPTR